MTTAKYEIGQTVFGVTLHEIYEEKICQILIESATCDWTVVTTAKDILYNLGQVPFSSNALRHVNEGELWIEQAFVFITKLAALQCQKKLLEIKIVEIDRERVLPYRTLLAQCEKMIEEGDLT